ncbi:DUF1778 domain-containing protein [Rouxiella sp. T17]|uniref:type II toxin-antitoxin system TacA family antitoxin n=1 Tax=Rouxiella sp. T17 TaxID=3085684 RepID=UPI002FCB8068
MPTPNSQRPASKRESLNLRIRAEDRDLIDRAAQIKGKNRTDFILEAAKSAAQLALLDQTVLMINPESYAAFIAELDSPAQINETLRRTLQTPAPWDK